MNQRTPGSFVKRISSLSAGSALLVWLTVACGSSDGASPAANGGAGGVSGAGGAGATGTGVGGRAGASMGGGTSVGGTAPSNGGLPDVGTTVGQTDGVLPKATVLPRLTNVAARVREDSVGIDFDPVDGAKDYRVYVLPKDGDVTVNGDSVVVKDATYRCAGVRQGWDAVNSVNKDDTTLSVPQGEYTFKLEIPDNPTLGHVFVTPGDGRKPVYALAGYASPPEYGWRETRLKTYTTDEAERKTLLADGWRDDGVVFYVPGAGAGTVNVYGSAVTQDKQHKAYYFGEADKDAHAKDTVPPKAAFAVLTAPADGTVPLMAVTYDAANPHTELTAGKERFQRAAYQGQAPMWHVEWSGVTEPVTLVVEALDSGCPFQGLLSPSHLDAVPKGEFAEHQAFLTLDDLRKASSTGEVYVNGQYDDAPSPKAIARSFVQVEPTPHDAAAWDWYQGFAVGSDLGEMTELPTDHNTCWLCGRWKSPMFDVAAYNIDTPNGVRMLTFGNVLGQMYVDFDDWAQDVTGKVRFTATEKAKIDDDPEKFLHVTMSVDIVSTDRRYPQLILSDQEAPVQEGFGKTDSDSLIIQSIGGPSSRVELQAIHGLVGTGDAAGPWDVNNQAPSHPFIDFDAYEDLPYHHPPADPAFELSGADRLTRFDAYVSAQRMYLFLEGVPVGCTRYPASMDLKGRPVTVTVGAVIYHEGADDEMVWHQPKPYGYWHRHEATETKRHFDDLAFKNAVTAPTWDDKRFPCADY